jgi:transposase
LPGNTPPCGPPKALWIDAPDRHGGVSALFRVGYAGPKLRDAIVSLGRWTLEIFKRSDNAKGFEAFWRPFIWD